MSARSDKDAPELETLPPEAEAFDRPTAVGRGVLDVTQVAQAEPVSSGRRAVGLTWADVLATAPSLGVKLRALVETLDALATIHTNLVRPPKERCHGALNPHLLLLTADGRVSVFWQSLEGIDSARLLPYVAPEIRSGAEPDQQADLYAVGVMLFEALADRLPDPSESLPSLQRGVHDPQTEPGPEALLKVALKALPPNPRRRWPSALLFAEALSKSAGSLLASRSELGQVVARAVSQKERLLRETMRKQHALLPPPGGETSPAYSDLAAGSLTAIAISQSPGPRSYEPVTAMELASARSRRRVRYPLYALGLALTLMLTLGLWLISRNTSETARAPSDSGEPSSPTLGAPATGTAEMGNKQLDLDSALATEREDAERQPSPTIDLDEPAAAEQDAREAETKTKAQTGASKSRQLEDGIPAKATTSPEQRGVLKRTPKQKSYEPEGI